MKRLILFVIIPLFAVISCSKTEKSSESAAGSEKASGPNNEAKPSSAEPSAENAKVAPIKSDKLKDKSAVKAATPKPVERKARIEAPSLPAAPTENILTVIRNANTRCRADQAVCPERDALAAKIATELDAAKSLLKKGTDQQKLALRAALLRSRNPVTDALLVQGIISDSGALDRRVAASIRLLRTTAAMDAIVDYLKTANGPDAALAIDTLGYLAGPKVPSALLNVLKDKRLMPFWGEACRGLSRRLHRQALDAVSAVARRLSVTERQAAGCSGAQAAFHMLDSTRDLNFNVDGTRLVVRNVLVYQRPSDPNSVYMDVNTVDGATCDKLGQADLVLKIPLGRSGAPVLNDGVVPSITYKAKDLGDQGAFLFQWDTLTLKPSAPVKGQLHLSHTRQSDPRLIVSGRFEGTYCGVNAQ